MAWFFTKFCVLVNPEYNAIRLRILLRNDSFQVVRAANIYSPVNAGNFMLNITSKIQIGEANNLIPINFG
jgi:hypothetical protein